MSLFLRTYFANTISSTSHPSTPSPITADMEVLFQAAHDIRSPLSALNMTTHHFKKNNPHLEHLDLMNEAVRRINNIAEDILRSRSRKKDHTKNTSFDILRTAQYFAAEFRRQNPADLEIMVAYNIHQDFTLKAQGQTEAFLRILWNLAENAKEASANSLRITLNRQDQQGLIRIQDNGHGIPHELLDQIGDKGFSTKRRGHGLGIYGAIQTVRKWNGDVRIASQVGVGTTIEIQLPLSIS